LERDKGQGIEGRENTDRDHVKVVKERLEEKVAYGLGQHVYWGMGCFSGKEAAHLPE
jgi:hypothetical protein